MRQPKETSKNGREDRERPCLCVTVPGLGDHQGAGFPVFSGPVHPDCEEGLHGVQVPFSARLATEQCGMVHVENGIQAIRNSCYFCRYAGLQNQFGMAKCTHPF